MAELQGVFLKGVVGGLLSGNLLFPEYKAEVEKMKDEEWYSWDLYTRMLQDISGKLPPVAVKRVAMNVIRAGKHIFIKQQGFDTLEKLLKGYADMFDQTIRGLPAHERIKLIQYEDGHVIMHYTTRQPKDFNEGVLYAFFEFYDVSIRSFHIHQINEHYYEVEITW